MLSKWLLLLWLGSWSAGVALAGEPDWRLYDRLLDQYVSQQRVDGLDLTWVDYSALAGDERFDALTDQLARFDPRQLANDRERLAFYINAYNILAIKVVRDHWPLTGIKQAGAWYRPVWKIEAGRIGGQPVSLDGIEQGILRPLKEPRIHFAIVCASRSCPDLAPVAYRAATLDGQLDRQVGRFLANPGKGLVEAPGGVRVSRIFDWFEEDFAVRGGVAAFIGGYRPRPERITGYLDYDWRLNGH